MTRFDPKQASLVVIVKGTFQLRHGARAEWADEPEPVAGDEFDSDEYATTLDELGGLRYASDAAPFKPKADALLVGKVHTPSGRPLPACSATFTVGDTSLELVATGDRYWLEPSSDAISEPTPFEQLPLGYARAFGGAGHTANPVGKGIFRPDAKNPRERPLPNIEDPRSPVRSPSDRPAPAGFGPLAAHWSYRLSRWPAFDPQWLEERWPWAPADLDYSYFNAAQPGLQMDGFLGGNEKIVCENLHAAHRRYTSELPNIRARCFVLDEHQEKANAPSTERFREAPLQLDTLWIDMEEEKLVLVWRGHIPVLSEELDEVRYAFVASESLDDAPKSAAHYRERFELARATSEGASSEAPVVPTAAEQAPSNDNDAAIVPEDPDPVEIQAVESPSLLPDSIRDLMVRSGTPPEVIALIAAGNIEGATATLSEMCDLKPGQLDQMMDESRQKLKAHVVAAGGDPTILDPPEPKPAAPMPSEPVPPKPEEDSDALWSRERVEACLATDTPLSGADLSGLDLSGLDFSGRDLSGTILTGGSVAQAWLEGTDLSQANLAGVTATGAKMARAKLTDADLTGLDAAECDLTEAELDSAVLDEAVLTSAQLDRCQAPRASFVKANLSDASLAKANLQSARFDEAVLENAKLRECDLSSASAESVRAANIDLSRAVLTKFNASEGSVLTHAKLRGVSADGSHWMNADFRGADLSRATFARADLSRCQLAGASMVGTNAHNTDFTAAHLTKASLVGANLMGCRLENASLQLADLREASLYEANLLHADLSGCKLDGALTAGTMLGTPVQSRAITGP